MMRLLINGIVENPSNLTEFLCTFVDNPYKNVPRLAGDAVGANFWVTLIGSTQRQNARWASRHRGNAPVSQKQCWVTPLDLKQPQMAK